MTLYSWTASTGMSSPMPPPKMDDVLDAVQQNLSAGLALAVDGVADAASVRFWPLPLRSSRGAAGGAVTARDVAGESNEVVRIAREARQVRNLLRVDDLGQFLGLRVDLRAAFANHLHFSHGGADRELRVKRHMSTHRHFNLRGKGFKLPAVTVTWYVAGSSRSLRTLPSKMRRCCVPHSWPCS